MQASKLLAWSLKKNGIRDVFFYPGACLLPIAYSLEDCGIRKITMRSDASIPHACNGFFQASGKVAVGFAGAGPAFTNLLTGLAAAKADGIPMVIFVANMEKAVIGAGGFQDFEMCKAAVPFVKKAFFARDGSSFACTVQAAFAACTSGRPGPVLVEVPRDVWVEEVDVFDLKFEQMFFSEKILSLSQLENSSVSNALSLCTAFFDCVVTGNGLHKYVAMQSFCGKKLISSDSFGCMGFSLPAAIGACIALKEQVFLFVGDGDFNMCSNELGTILQYGLPLKIVVFNNSSFGSINQLRRENCRPVEKFANPDFELIARAYGLDYLDAEESTLPQCIKRACSSLTPCLIDFRCELSVLEGIPLLRKWLNENRIKPLATISIAVG
ncbi:MAG: thiamine pyrophosphate-dependent enzyme [Candidatus Micrarchaeota archaeon]